MKTCFFLLISVISLSCSKNHFCGKCNTPWVNDQQLVYHKGDVVTHNGKCYKAFTQGGASACEPGTPSGDIWEECK